MGLDYNMFLIVSPTTFHGDLHKNGQLPSSEVAPSDQDQELPSLAFAGEIPCGNHFLDPQHGIFKC